MGYSPIFDFDGNTWTETAKLIASDASLDDKFGNSVSVSGNTVIVGARGPDYAEVSPGSAYLFEFDGTSWTEIAKITASDAVNGDRFGISVSLSLHRAIVGADGKDDAGSNSGSAYIFE